MGELARGTVEDTINGMLDEEAERLCGAGKHERSPDRQNFSSGYYQRNLTTKAGDVKLNVPKMRHLPFETAIIERYKRLGRLSARVEESGPAEKLKAMKLGVASEKVLEGAEETLMYMSYPREHWIKLRTNNPMERVMKELRPGQELSDRFRTASRP